MHPRALDVRVNPPKTLSGLTLQVKSQSLRKTKKPALGHAGKRGG